MQFKDYYQILGVERNASTDDIKRAYRRLARKYHPDVSTEKEAEARFKEVAEAYEVLRDAEKRAAYDRLGADWRAGEEFTPPPGWDAAFDFGQGFRGGGHFDFSDFFETLFGERHRARGPGARQRHARPDRVQAGAADERIRFRITLEEAYHGGERSLALRASPGTRGPGGTRTVRVKIPKGMVPGRQIRLAGQGRTGAQGRRGDLYLEVEFAPHPVFRAEGKDIHMTLPIAPWEAALGAAVEVPTLGGKVDMKVPPGSQSGRKLRLKGKGLGGADAGDQYATLQIVTPPADDEKAKRFYREMAKELPFDPRRTR